MTLTSRDGGAVLATHAQPAHGAQCPPPGPIPHRCAEDRCSPAPAVLTRRGWVLTAGARLSGSEHWRCGVSPARRRGCGQALGEHTPLSTLPIAVMVPTAPSLSLAFLAFWTAVGLHLCEKGRVVLCPWGSTYQLGTWGHLCALGTHGGDRATH